MAKITMEDALALVTAKTDEDGKKKLNRFSKKNFEKFMMAAMNDVEFTTESIKVEGGKIAFEEDSKVTIMFREWLKRVIESAGVDKAESERVLSADFEINSVKGLYEFFTAAVYEYMKAGNYFQFPDRHDFRGNIYLKENDETIVTKEAKNPRTGEILGTYETKKSKYTSLAAKSPAPKWLTSRKKLG